MVKERYNTRSDVTHNIVMPKKQGKLSAQRDALRGIYLVYGYELSPAVIN